MILKKFLLTILFIFCCSQYVVSQINLKGRDNIESVTLKEGYAYAKFTSNNRYLVWMEDYTGKLFIYDIKNRKLNSEQLKKGRGPHEYSVIQSIALTSKNDIILNDSKNMKWIVYQINNGEYKKDIKFDSFNPSHISVHNGIIFMLSSINTVKSSLYGTMNIEDRKIKSVNMKKYRIQDEFSYVYKRSGWVTSNADYGIHLALYYPNIYVVDKQNMSVQKKIKFDYSDTKKGKTMDTGEGNKLYVAPREYDLSNKDVAFVPGMDYSILMLIKGKGEQRSYKTSELKVYNFKQEKFTQTLDLGIKATYITVNDNNLFVYSKEENEIFQYEIVQD